MIALLANIGPHPFDTAWLSAALVLTTPVLLAAVGELVSERAGVLNVGLEGMMLAGAFFSYLVAFKLHSSAAGVLGGVGAGLLFAVVMALLTVEAGADQIVAGVGINLAAAGLTAYLFAQIFGNLPSEVVPTIHNAAIPGLSKIPQFGPALFDHDIVTTYVSFLLVPVVWFVLYRTRWGLAIRAAGELPAAADTAGISVRRLRWMGVLTAGALSGLAGVNLAIVQVGVFHQDMTAGRGFLALVAVIFGRWRPLGVLAACLVLGGADALQLRLTDQSSVPRVVWAAIVVVVVAIALYQLVGRRGATTRRAGIGVLGLIALSGAVLFATRPDVNLPNQLWRSLPYLVALVVLAGGISRAHMPAKLTLPYRRGEG